MALVLTRTDVEALLTMEDCIEAVADVQVEFSKGAAVMPVRLPTSNPGVGTHLSMPAWLTESGALGMKSITFFPGNADRGLPLILGLVMLMDSDTGALLALMDGVHVTAVRTAAASAVATRALAVPGARELAILGSGVQAESHLEAMLAVRPIESVRVASRTRASAERFVERERAKYPAVELAAVDTPRQAIAGADVVCAVSLARDPLTAPEWLEPGCHVNGVGSHTPDAREIDGETMRRARVVVDSRDANLRECGDCMIPIGEGLFGPEHVSDEIGEVLAGTKPGRTSPEEITVYQSCGIAVQDVAAARLVYAKARERGVGLDVDL